MDNITVISGDSKSPRIASVSSVDYKSPRIASVSSVDYKSPRIASVFFVEVPSPRIASVIIFVILAFVIYILATKFVFNGGQKHYENNCDILDLGFKLVPDLRESTSIYNIKETLYFMLILLFVIYTGLTDTSLLKEYAITIGTIYIIKSFLFAFTILPDPSNKCKQFDITGLHQGSCFDLIISMHTVLLVTALVVMFKNNLFGIGKWIFSGITIFILFLILALRQHYTMDIILGALFSFFVYNYVHDYFNNVKKYEPES